MKVMVIHGKKDVIVPYSCGEEILQRIPWAHMVEVGSLPGQVPDLDFGHQWSEYFDIQVWHDVVEGFMADAKPSHTARL